MSNTYKHVSELTEQFNTFPENATLYAYDVDANKDKQLPSNLLKTSYVRFGCYLDNVIQQGSNIDYSDSDLITLEAFPSALSPYNMIKWTINIGTQQETILWGQKVNISTNAEYLTNSNSVKVQLINGTSVIAEYSLDQYLTSEVVVPIYSFILNVTDEDTNSPFSSLSVYIKINDDDGYYKTTDSNGTILIENLNAGDVLQYSIDKDGYQSKNESVLINANINKGITLFLNKFNFTFHVKDNTDFEHYVPNIRVVLTKSDNTDSRNETSNAGIVNINNCTYGSYTVNANLNPANPEYWEKSNDVTINIDKYSTDFNIDYTLYLILKGKIENASGLIQTNDDILISYNFNPLYNLQNEYEGATEIVYNQNSTQLKTTTRDVDSPESNDYNILTSAEYDPSGGPISVLINGKNIKGEAIPSVTLNVELNSGFMYGFVTPAVLMSSIGKSFSEITKNDIETLFSDSTNINTFLTNPEIRLSKSYINFDDPNSEDYYTGKIISPYTEGNVLFCKYIFNAPSVGYPFIICKKEDYSGFNRAFAFEQNSINLDIEYYLDDFEFLFNNIPYICYFVIGRGDPAGDYLYQSILSSSSSYTAIIKTT